MAMRDIGRLALILAGLATGGMATAQEQPGVLKGADGTAIGKVSVEEGAHGVLLRVTAQGLPPGWHGIHFHEKGTCSDTGFKASGSHVHTQKPIIHGLLNPQANDDGDLPNVYVASDGTLNAELFTSFVSLGGGGKRPALRDADGSALVIHANPDDYKSQPIGGAGDRIACAIIP